jgi:hypothetical protein
MERPTIEDRPPLDQPGVLPRLTRRKTHLPNVNIRNGPTIVRPQQ